jgi:hypothetical protein
MLTFHACPNNCHLPVSCSLWIHKHFPGYGMEALNLYKLRQLIHDHHFILANFWKAPGTLDQPERNSLWPLCRDCPRRPLRATLPL